MALSGRKPLKKATPVEHGPQEHLFLKKVPAPLPALPAEDNTPEGLRALLEANAYYR